MTGHTSWSVLRDETYAARPGMADRVAALRVRDGLDLDGGELWEIALEAEAEGEALSPETLKQQLVDAVGQKASVLEADVKVLSDNGGGLLLVLLVIVVGAITSKRFEQADEAAEIVRLRLEDYGSVVSQSIRRAA